MAKVLLSEYSASSRPIRPFSFGGGVQSVAVAVLQAQGRIKPYDVYLFANVGDDSEEEGTLTYFREIFLPWAEKNGIVAHEIRKMIIRGPNAGQPAETLYQNVMGNNRSVAIPAWMSGGAPGVRTCTTDWKIRVVNRWIKDRKYTHAVMGIGFSADEAERAKGGKEDWHDVEGLKAKKPRKLGFNLKQEYPLLDLGLSRADCEAIILSAGLPLPPKSACWFCPFSSKSRWIGRKLNQPEVFQKSCAMEAYVNDKRGALGRDRVTLFPGGQPLAVAIPDQMPMFDFDDGGCDTGYCHT